MYTLNIGETFNYPKIFASGLRLFEQAKKAFNFSGEKAKNENEGLPYIIQAIENGLTVIDISAHTRSFLFQMLKLEKGRGRIISFESNTLIYKYLSKLQGLLKLKHVTIEASIFDGGGEGLEPSTLIGSKGATVIDFYKRTAKEEYNRLETLDQYCEAHNLTPGLIKIGVDGNEMNFLEGSLEILEKYKPDVLIECSLTHRNRESLLAAFTLLTDMNYAGFFILDNMKIPLRSFDFNTYQNEIMGFYCNTFYFVG